MRFKRSNSSQYEFSCFFNLRRSIFKNLNSAPYIETTKTNKIPKKTFVLYIAKISNALETLTAKNCINEKTVTTNTRKTSIENKFNVELIIKNQNDNPIETAMALNLGEENCILYRIN